MTPYYEADGITLYQGHVLDVLAGLPADSVSCIVTSPPYWSLRKYDAPDVVWGGDGECEHEWSDPVLGGESFTGSSRWQHQDTERSGGHSKGKDEGITRATRPDAWQKQTPQGSTCSSCSSWRGQYGLEPTPELYVEHTLMVLRAIRRVLRPDGVVFWNVGDGYANDTKWGGATGGKHARALHGNTSVGRDRRQTGLKPKDLILMPERVALAAQADGWWVRSRTIWHKPNAMPESAKDRPTDDHEHIWMLTKSARYWSDFDAVREPQSPLTLSKANGAPRRMDEDRDGHEFDKDSWVVPGGRNLRTVWSFPTAQTPEAHFATFPPELPRRCIEAACPREVCATCRKARVRLTETQYIKNRPSAGNDPRSRKEDKLSTAGVSAHYSPLRGYRGNNLLAETTTVGWSDCGHDNYEPGIVLDPFAGLATTGIVARRLGRRFVGIELSEKYADMAAKKLALWWQDARIVEGDVPEGQAALWNP